MKRLIACAGAFICFAGTIIAQTTNASASVPAWITSPLTLADCLNIALSQNATLLKAKNDMDAQHGLAAQPRAVGLQQLTANATYKDTDRSAMENFPNAPDTPNQNWNAGLKIIQTIYQGGALKAAVRAARATKEQALA